MKKIRLYADSSCDLNLDFLNKNNIKLLPFNLIINDNKYKDMLDISTEKLLKYIKNGIIPKTSQINPNYFLESIKKDLDEGYDIIYITLSSKLSETYNSCCLAKQNINCNNVYVIDSKGASIGLGIIFKILSEHIQNGENIEFILKKAKYLINNTHYYFSPGSLDLLCKGGRLSTSQAFIGNLLNIKPLLTIKDGALHCQTKVRGNKLLVNAFIKLLKEKKFNKNYPIGIAHCNNINIVINIVNRIKEEFEFTNIIISNIGSVLTSHIGEGSIAITFISESTFT